MMAESLKSFEYVIKLSMHLTIPNSFQMLYISLINCVMFKLKTITVGFFITGHILN